nr:uncharacterized protein LOC129443790 [Misgurnus anguillicaudatus]
MMNRTFVIIQDKFQVFETAEWVSWFTVTLTPILSGFTAEMLVTVTDYTNCTNYQVIVKGLDAVFLEMSSIRRQEIANVLVEHLKKFADQFNAPACGSNIHSDAQWLNINLGLFSTLASYSDLRDLNITLLASLESLSPEQKAQLLLDASTGALENETVVKEVLGSVLESHDEMRLEQFYATFVEVTKQQNITYIENAAVRDTMLNMTLTALAPEFPNFQTGDYMLWFQTNLVVLLASFRPSDLVVIPANLSCDSYDAILQGLESALAALPSQLRKELKASIVALRGSPPDGCTPPHPVGVCNETPVDEESLCRDVNTVPLESGSVSGGPCDISIPQYACSSVATLSPHQLAALLACKPASGAPYGAEVWKLFVQKFEGVLEDALSENSIKNLSDVESASRALDAIGEVIVYKFDAAELADVSFVGPWFEDRLTPFLPAISGGLLSCLSSKNFTCDTYHVVVRAFSAQASHIRPEQKQAVVDEFILPFLSRRDIEDPGCLAGAPSTGGWLAENFGELSPYVTVKDLQTLNRNFTIVSNL